MYISSSQSQKKSIIVGKGHLRQQLFRLDARASQWTGDKESVIDREICVLMYAGYRNSVYTQYKYVQIQKHKILTNQPFHGDLRDIFSKLYEIKCSINCRVVAIYHMWCT